MLLFACQFQRKKKSALNHSAECTVLDDIPELDCDDSRIEQANSEGEMENYEVKKKKIELNLKNYVKISFDSYFEINSKSI
jgi:hypothetical protein